MAAQRRIDLVLDSVTRLMRMGASANLLNLLQKQHPADLAQIFTALRDRDREAVFGLLAGHNARLAMEAVSELGAEAGALLLATRPAEEIARLAQEIPSDDAAALIDYLPDELSASVLTLMRPEESGVVENLLEYEEQTAGRIMNPKVFALRADQTAADAVSVLQESGGVEMPFYLYVVDGRRHLLGVVSLRRLLLVNPRSTLGDIMGVDLISVTSDTGQEEVARLVAKYNLLAVPVVDAENKLIGTVTVDDVIDVLKDETTADIQKLGGLEALDEPYMSTPFATLIKKRARWLIVLFVGEMLTATAMSYFEHEIAKAVVLALFVPLVISSGGNSGSQAASLMIRALAVGEVTVADWWRVMRREALSGAALGAILGGVGFIRVIVWAGIFGSYGAHWLLLAVTVTLSLLGVVLWGTLAGSMLPFVLKRVGADPATSSAPFVATLVDVTGLMIYFSTAAVLFRGTLL
jgi:magnesium transporter